MNGLLHGEQTVQARSLRRRLLLRVSLATLLIYVLAAALTYRQARHEVQELMDGQMTKAARLLLVQAGSDSRHLANLADSMAALRGVKSRRNEMALEFQIGSKDGTRPFALEARPGKPAERQSRLREHRTQRPPLAQPDPGNT